MQNLQVVCHNHQRMKQKFIFLNGQTGDVSIPSLSNLGVTGAVASDDTEVIGGRSS